MMKRYGRRALGVVIGLALGWLAQGYLHDLTAATPQTEVVAVASGQASAGEAARAGDAMLAGAEHLALSRPELAGWGCALALGVAGLFAAALILGGPAHALMGTAATQTHDDLAGH